ncbi:S1C family serine protease [Caminicella sporogenes]|uniref:S1C family serine protease n=1 Tax=Caminicella sporogenes TaxID=166485 RepID=UPI002541894D|nr:trypsin-like peptidase domain-containing protein [Caminicella sporogenes]WIF94918.1 trypsin-like peptidase domain-containing protein [Caminicella sporogenes]
MKKGVGIFLIICMLLSITAVAFASENEQKVTDETANKVNKLLKQLKNESNKVSDVIDKVNKSVVAVIGENKKYRERDFIYSKFPKNLQHGSGVVVSSDGRIITNNHVVDGLEDIYVVTYNGSPYKAELLYADKEIDLALLKINGSDIKPIKFADEKELKVGTEVIAIGTPLFFGYRNSASKGIISGLNRPVDRYYTYLQTDASINPGNSGGPLVNMEGELVGINTRGYMFYQGMNFSIPINNINYFLDQYNRFGRIRRCYTGIEFEENWAAMLGIPTNQGLKVVTLQKDAVVTPQQVKEGDILEAINGQKTTSIAQYNEILKGFLPGDKVELTFIRDNEKFNITVTLSEKSES